MDEPAQEFQEDNQQAYTHGSVDKSSDDSKGYDEEASDVEAVTNEEGFHPVDARYVPCERLSSLILFVAATLGSVVAYLAMLISDADPLLMVLAAIVLPVVCLGLLWNAIFWPAIEYRHIYWKLSEVGLEIRRGVFWKHQIAIPWARAQHADVSQGPVQRMFEIGSLTIHTAGTKNSSVSIDGLAHTRAIEMRDEIIRQRKEHDVV